jgi:hypothetical protein
LRVARCSLLVAQARSGAKLSNGLAPAFVDRSVDQWPVARLLS